MLRITTVQNIGFHIVVLRILERYLALSSDILYFNVALYHHRIFAAKLVIAEHLYLYFAHT